MDQARLEIRKATEIFEDAPLYEHDQMAELLKLAMDLEYGTDEEKAAALHRFVELRGEMKKVREQERIYLWPCGNMPQDTVFTDADRGKFNHDENYTPYMYDFPLPDSVTPKGVLIAIAGGDHGNCCVAEGYQVCMDFRERGYQTFMLNNRTNRCPWSEFDCGADVARAIQYIRANAGKYRVAPDRIGVAGFSNGGLTGENCILHYSGKKTVAEHYPDYVPDELDQYPGSPDSFMCVYGPRYKGVPMDFTGVVYPPTFFAVGRDDSAMDNLNYVLPILMEHGVTVEIHTYAGTPHGVAGKKFITGQPTYPLFETWLDLADAFMQDVYNKRDGK